MLQCCLAAPHAETLTIKEMKANIHALVKKDLRKIPGMHLTKESVDAFFNILTIETIQVVDGVGVDIYKAVSEIFGRRNVNFVDKHVDLGILSIRFEAFLKKIYYMIHGEEMQPLENETNATFATCINAFDCLNTLRSSTLESEQRIYAYLNSIRQVRNNQAHSSPTMQETQLDEKIKEALTLYIYVVGKCYDAIEARYAINN